MKNIVSLFILTLFAFFSASAQKPVLKSGSLSALKGQKEINLVYEYEGMKVGTGKKAKKESDYVNAKVEEYNKKEPGRGDKWKEAWTNTDRSNRYQPKFEELLNKGLEKQGVKAAQNLSTAKYTLKVVTTRVEPGWNIGVTKYPAYLDVMVYLMETGGTKELAVIEILNSPGSQAMGFDYDTGTRVAEGYAKAGKSLAAFLAKNLK
jgi:murein L,D-transpeptidase YcbB/YkuD